MLLQDQIKKLKEVHYNEPKKVFTMYLNTDPRSPEQQKGEWKIKLKNALKDLADATKDSDSHEEKNQSKTIREKVEKEVYGKERELLRGLVLFATADEDLWFSEALHIPVETEFHWTNEPDLSQLKNLEETYPYTGVVVLQQDKALVLETEVGAMLGQTHYTLDMDTDEWREHQGPQGDDWTQGGAKKDEYQEHVEALQQRWFKSLAQTIEKKAKDHEWRQIYLVGGKDEIDPLQTYFNKKIDKTIPRNILNHDANKILSEVLDE